MPSSLSDAKARNAKPRPKPYKISDGEGLFLLIMPTGSKYWRLKYFFADKEKVLAIGVYPEITLADARERRAQARKELANGRDPGETKKEAKQLIKLNASNSFEAVAREWFENQSHKWEPVATPCPSCKMPGWGRIGTEKGLRCEYCDQETSMVVYETYGGGTIIKNGFSSRRSPCLLGKAFQLRLRA